MYLLCNYNDFCINLKIIGCTFEKNSDIFSPIIVPKLQFVKVAVFTLHICFS